MQSTFLAQPFDSNRQGREQSPLRQYCLVDGLRRRAQAFRTRVIYARDGPLQRIETDTTKKMPRNRLLRSSAEGSDTALTGWLVTRVMS